MDREEVRRRGLRELDPVPDIPVKDQVEPWAWKHKIKPRRIRELLRLYYEYLGQHQGDQGHES